MRSLFRNAGIVVLQVLLILGVLMARAEAKRPSFSLSVSPRDVSLGDTVTVIVRIELPGLEGPDRYWHPVIARFRQVDSQVKRGTETIIDAKKGQQLTTVWVYRYVLKPLETGSLAVGPARIRVHGDDWETRERFVRVRATGSIGTSTVAIGHTSAAALKAPGYQAPQGDHNDVFLYAVCDKEHVWVGEQFTVSWLLFARAEVLKYEPTPPRLRNLWSETLFEPKMYLQYSDARVGGKDYVVALVSKRALFATKAGELRIRPLRAHIATLTTATGRGEEVSSNAITLNVNKLPQPAPARFDATYVGEFKLQASVDRDLLPAGDALTMSLRVSEEGAIGRTTPPILFFPGFQFEEPRDFDEKSTTMGNVVSGERLYRYWTTPSRGGEQSIPAVSLPYFSPREGRYLVATSRAIGITVQGDPVAQALARKRMLASTIDRDIRLLHTGDEVQGRVLADLYKSRWFWVLLLLPAGALLGVALESIIRAKFQAETHRTRLRRARAKAKGHYKLAEIHIRGERSSKFFGELSFAVYGHLEELLGSKLQSMTREQVRGALEGRGIEGGTIRRLLDELENFDRERFAPSSMKPDKMREAMARADKLLRAVEAQERAAAELELEREARS